jgi:hypothetical protein
MIATLRFIAVSWRIFEGYQSLLCICSLPRSTKTHQLSVKRLKWKNSQSLCRWLDWTRVLLPIIDFLLFICRCMLHYLNLESIIETRKHLRPPSIFLRPSDLDLAFLLAIKSLIIDAWLLPISSRRGKLEDGATEAWGSIMASFGQVLFSGAVEIPLFVQPHLNVIVHSLPIEWQHPSESFPNPVTAWYERAGLWRI